MIEKCELYCYEGIYLDNMSLDKLNIKKINGIGMLSLLQQFSKIVGVSNGDLCELDKNDFQSSLLLSNQYCYIIKKNTLIILPIVIYYGIKTDNEVSVVYKHENIRDAKFSEVLVKSILFMLDDMKDSEIIVNEINKQLRLKKSYDNLARLGE